MTAPTKWTYGSANMGGNFHDAAKFITKFHPDWDVVAMDFTGNNTVVVYRTAETASQDPAPDLRDVAEEIRIAGPDADGLVWVEFWGVGKRGALNAGNQYSIVGSAALAFETKRRAALDKARGEA